MATTVTPQSLKSRARAFDGLDNASVQTAIDEAVRWMSETQWGTSHYDDGVYYLACHILEEDARLNQGTAGETGDSIPAGPLKSERILSWSASYESSDAFNHALATTAWGRRFIAKCNLVFPDRRI